MLSNAIMLSNDIMLGNAKMQSSAIMLSNTIMLSNAIMIKLRCYVPQNKAENMQNSYSSRYSMIFWKKTQKIVFLILFPKRVNPLQSKQ